MLVLNRSPCSTTSTIRRSSMAHKLDLGFHHYNIQQTSPEALASRAPRGHLSTELLTAQIGNVVVRALPTNDSDYVDMSEGPAEPISPRNIDEEVLLAYGGQGSGLKGATQPPQEELSSSGRSALSKSSKGGTRDKDLLNAHWYPTMPKGPEAHNAAHCEPIPGDWPDPAPDMKPIDAVSPDENLDAIHAMGASHSSQSGPVGGTSAGAARDDSSAASHGVGMSEKGVSQQGAGMSQRDSHAASRPANDPQEIKDVVRHETLADHPQGEAA